MPFKAVAAMINTTVRLALRLTAAPSTFAWLGWYRSTMLKIKEPDHSEQVKDWFWFVLSVSKTLQTL